MTIKKDYQLKNIAKLMENLNKKAEEYTESSLRAMINFTIDVRRDMEVTSPKIPVDTGNLRASYFVVANRIINDPTKGQKKPKGEERVRHAQVKGMVKTAMQHYNTPAVAFGFSASYAIFVHENVDANFAGKKTGKKKDARRPGAGAKFFESAIARNKSNYVKYLKEEL